MYKVQLLKSFFTEELQNINIDYTGEITPTPHPNEQMLNNLLRVSHFFASFLAYEMELLQ